jgi:hypothetical protein
LPAARKVGGKFAQSTKSLYSQSYARKGLFLKSYRRPSPLLLCVRQYRIVWKFSRPLRSSNKATKAREAFVNTGSELPKNRGLAAGCGGAGALPQAVTIRGTLLYFPLFTLFQSYARKGLFLKSHRRPSPLLLCCFA